VTFVPSDLYPRCPVGHLTMRRLRLSPEVKAMFSEKVSMRRHLTCAQPSRPPPRSRCAHSNLLACGRMHAVILIRLAAVDAGLSVLARFFRVTGCVMVRFQTCGSVYAGPAQLVTPRTRHRAGPWVDSDSQLNADLIPPQPHWYRLICTRAKSSGSADDMEPV
jgi:hypothetical protein